jgi:hypothetical protein
MASPGLRRNCDWLKGSRMRLLVMIIVNVGPFPDQNHRDAEIAPPTASIFLHVLQMQDLAGGTPRMYCKHRTYAITHL